jgi:conjugal transfer/entry exclusion protein
MKNLKRKLIFSAAAIGLLPAATFAVDLVFDPTNFIQIVEEVAQDVKLVEQAAEQIKNQGQMLKSWGYSQLDGIRQQMNGWEIVLTPGIYSSSDAGAQFNANYPLDPTHYDGMTDLAISNQRNQWDAQERAALVENRTVQNQTYQNIAVTATRIANDLEQSNHAPGMTAAVQAGNEEIASLIAQLQTLTGQEITDARTEAEREAREQAEDAYATQQVNAVRAGWNNSTTPVTGLADVFPLAK